MLEDGLQRNTREMVAKAAHGLKGLSGSLFAHHVLHTATLLESQAAEGASFTDLRALCTELQRQMEALFSALDEQVACQPV
jgi:HPt (histidine-containing phosphotransfer) domain-containing protein